MMCSGVSMMSDDCSSRAEYSQLDPLHLLSSLSLTGPPTPTYGSNTAFPFLTPSTPVSSTTPRSASSTPAQASSSSPRPAQTPTSKKEGIHRKRSVRTERRREKFAKVLRGRLDDGGGVDLGESELSVLERFIDAFTAAELRRLAWSGIPNEVRPIAWQLLLVRMMTLHWY